MNIYQRLFTLVITSFALISPLAGSQRCVVKSKPCLIATQTGGDVCKDKKALFWLMGQNNNIYHQKIMREYMREYMITLGITDVLADISLGYLYQPYVKMVSEIAPTVSEAECKVIASRSTLSYRWQADRCDKDLIFNHYQPGEYRYNKGACSLILNFLDRLTTIDDLRLYRDACINPSRIGTSRYQEQAFHEICSRMNIMMRARPFPKRKVTA